MERRILRYIVNFFLYLLIGFLLLGLFIKIEYKNKTGKDVIGMFEWGLDDYLTAKKEYERDKELENIITIDDAYNNALKYGGSEKDLVNSSIKMHEAYDIHAAEFDSFTKAFVALDHDDLFQNRINHIRSEFKRLNIGPKTSEFLIKSGLGGYSEDEMFKGVKEIEEER